MVKRTIQRFTGLEAILIIWVYGILRLFCACSHHHLQQQDRQRPRTLHTPTFAVLGPPEQVSTISKVVRLFPHAVLSEGTPERQVCRFRISDCL
ncbi:hypothetical protein C8Q72DRAFT_811003 [Fomitopsis betulina]|nr:hypothetical protein C8Q72DRAFT_811003 [Fomitopsis betulina]